MYSIVIRKCIIIMKCRDVLILNTLEFCARSQHFLIFPFTMNIVHQALGIIVSTVTHVLPNMQAAKTNNLSRINENLCQVPENRILLPTVVRASDVRAFAYYWSGAKAVSVALGTGVDTCTVLSALSPFSAGRRGLNSSLCRM